MLKNKLRLIFARFFSKIIAFGLRFYLYFISYDHLTLIYTPGKVGSASIYNNLKKFRVNNIFHLHYLNPLNIKNQIALEKNSDRKSIPFHLILSIALHEKLKLFKKIDIICLSRNPYQRHISSYFQNIYRDKKNFLQDDFLDENYIVGKLKKSLPFAAKEMDYWFDTELKHVFNIDIFKEFKENNIINCIQKNNITVHFMKTEDLNDKNQSNLIMKIIGKNLTNKYIPIKKINDSSKRFYSNQYISIKNQLNLLEIKLELFKVNTKIYK